MKIYVSKFSKKRLVLSIVLCSLLGFIDGCTQKEAVIPEKVLSTDITVDQAKALYEKQMSGQLSARTSKRKRKERPAWETGRNLTLSDGKKSLVVVIEEDQDALTLVAFDKDTNSVKSFEELFTSVKLVVYKDEKGKEHIERMYIKGDLDYAKRKKFHYEDSDFTGKIWFEDFEDNFLRGFFYKDGKTIGIQTINDPSKQNARVAYTCSWITETVTTTTNYYSIACYMNGSNITCGQPMFMYSTTGSVTNIVWASCWDDGTSSGNPVGASLYIEDPGFWEWWKKLNGLEINWLLANPAKAYKAYENFMRAEVSSFDRFGGQDIKDENGTNQNAYKHAYAAALHTISWGPNVALTIMNNHEGGTGNPSLDSQMDYWNNALGISVVNTCGCDGETLRNSIISRMTTGPVEYRGRRYIYGNSQQSPTLIPTTSANIDND